MAPGFVYSSAQPSPRLPSPTQSSHSSPGLLVSCRCRCRCRCCWALASFPLPSFDTTTGTSFVPYLLLSVFCLASCRRRRRPSHPLSALRLGHPANFADPEYLELNNGTLVEAEKVGSKGSRPACPTCTSAPASSPSTSSPAANTRFPSGPSSKSSFPASCYRNCSVLRRQAHHCSNSNNNMHHNPSNNIPRPSRSLRFPNAMTSRHLLATCRMPPCTFTSKH